MLVPPIHPQLRETEGEQEAVVVSGMGAESHSMMDPPLIQNTGFLWRFGGQEV